MLRRVLPAIGLCLLGSACASPTAPLTESAPLFARGSTVPAINPNLAGHWRQTNQVTVVNASLGTTTVMWYEFDAKQSGGTLSGSAVRHMNVFNSSTGAVMYDNITGSPGKLLGTVKSDSTATIIFDRIDETKVTLSYAVKLDATGTLSVISPTAGGPQAFAK